MSPQDIDNANTYNKAIQDVIDFLDEKRNDFKNFLDSLNNHDTLNPSPSHVLSIEDRIRLLACLKEKIANMRQ